MSLAIFTAASVNGIVTPARGVSSLGLLSTLAVPEAVLELQRALRRGHDAVMVGTGTVLVDNPTLTSHRAPGHRPPVRVTIDPAGRIPAGARFLDGSVRTLVGVSETTPRLYLDLLAARGAEAVPAGDPANPARIDLGAFVEALAARDVRDLLVEGGGRLNRELLDRDLVDRLHLLLFPAVLDSRSVNLFDGGSGELRRLRFEGVERLDGAEGYLLLVYGVERRIR